MTPITKITVYTPVVLYIHGVHDIVGYASQATCQNITERSVAPFAAREVQRAPFSSFKIVRKRSAFTHSRDKS